MGSGPFFLKVSLPEGRRPLCWERGSSPRSALRGSTWLCFEDGVFVLYGHTRPAGVASNYLSVIAFNIHWHPGLILCQVAV